MKSGRKKTTTAEPKRDYVATARGYETAVTSGRLVACKWIRLLCAMQDRERRQSASDPKSPFVWTASYAEAACRFIERLPHVEGKWATPTIRLEPWQVFLLCALFGWRHRAAPSRRRYTSFFLQVSRKSAKSTLMAAIALFHMCEEDEPGASVICAASTGAQARIVFRVMCRMIQRSSWLRDQGLTAFANSITHDGTGGDAKPINSKSSTQDGLNPSVIVLDESHAQHFQLHDVLKSAQGARENPLLLAPTTAGTDLVSVGYALKTQVEKVLDGVFTADHLLGALYELDPDDEWDNPATWIKSAPMIGISPRVEWVQSFAQDARQIPGTEAEFQTKICNRWLHAASGWLAMSSWDACADPDLRLERFLGKRCWIGADNAQLDDIAAVSLVFEEDGLLFGFVRGYLPRGVVELRARKVPEYQSWVDAGVLRLTEGTMIDLAQIEADIIADCKRFNVQEISFDQFGSLQICGNLFNAGYPAIITPKNARTFTPPSRELEARVTHRTFRHDGGSLLKWAISNCRVTRRIDDTILVKKDSAESPNKIDPVDALILAISSLLSRRAAKPEPKYQMFVLSRQPRF